jgi:UDP:flavonoid glycosyltransferase YjiC (YdhE family)
MEMIRRLTSSTDRPRLESASNVSKPAMPEWWPELDLAPRVVLVNQGTIATHTDDLIRPALEALADEPVFVVATGGTVSGSASDADSGAALPGLTIPANGVPIIVAGTTEDKPEIGARVAWSGAGLNLKTSSPTPEQIRAAVHAVVDDDRDRHQAQRIADDYGRHDAPTEAADLLEQLASTEEARAVIDQEPG